MLGDRETRGKEETGEGDRVENPFDDDNGDVRESADVLCRVTRKLPEEAPVEPTA